MPVDAPGKLLTDGYGAEYASNLLTDGYGDWSGYTSLEPITGAGLLLTDGFGGRERPYLLTGGFGEFTDTAMDAGRLLTDGYGDRVEFLLTDGFSYIAEPSSGRGIRGLLARLRGR